MARRSLHPRDLDARASLLYVRERKVLQTVVQKHHVVGSGKQRRCPQATPRAPRSGECDNGSSPKRCGHLKCMETSCALSSWSCWMDIHGGAGGMSEDGSICPAAQMRTAHPVAQNCLAVASRSREVSIACEHQRHLDARCIASGVAARRICVCEGTGVDKGGGTAPAPKGSDPDLWAGLDTFLRARTS